MPGKNVLAPRSPLEGLRLPETDGVIVGARDGLGIAAVLARKAREDSLADLLRERFGIELPRGPRRFAAGDLSIAGTGPGAWLAVREGGGNAFARMLREAIGDLASVSDQSDAYAVVRLSGHSVRDTLCKLVPVDLHDRAFRIGDVAVTVAAEMNTTLWRLDDDASGSPVFEMAAYRSFAESFRHALP